MEEKRLEFKNLAELYDYVEEKARERLEKMKEEVPPNGS